MPPVMTDIKRWDWNTHSLPSSDYPVLPPFRGKTTLDPIGMYGSIKVG